MSKLPDALVDQRDELAFRYHDKVDAFTGFIDGFDACHEIMQAKLEIAMEALKTIKRGLGPYHQDPLKHAEDCIEAMKNVASEALAEIEVKSE